MNPLLLSSLFPEADPSELAAVVHDLGFAGVDLAVHGAPRAEAERTLALLAAEAAPARMITTDTCDVASLAEWVELASAAGCEAVVTAAWQDDGGAAFDRLAALEELAESAGVLCLVPNHAASLFSGLERLAELLRRGGGEHVKALLAPDQVPRSRTGDHAAWLARQELPAVGAVQLASYRWESEIGAGNTRLWSPRPALLAHGLTPWQAWLTRLRETGFNGHFTFGDAGLPASPGEHIRILRDDLRFVRRVWSREAD